jgi:hypothetical protein
MAETLPSRGAAELVALAARNGVLRRAVVVALVVGTVLNLINQGDRLISGTEPDWFKLILTYLVPFVVSTHGSMTVLMRSQGSPS